MKKYVLKSILLFIITSCQLNTDNTQNIESMIHSNQDNFVFLHFWVDMNNREFKKIASYETKKGNLKGSFGGEYSYNISIPFEIFGEITEKQIPFKISHSKGNYIKLSYRDEVAVKYEGVHEGYPKGQMKHEYEDIVNGIVKIFTDRYKCINIENNALLGIGKKYTLTDGKKLISLRHSISKYRRGSDSFIYRREDKEAIIDYIEIEIEYTTVEIQKRKKQNNIQRKKQLEIDNKEKLKQINNSNREL